MKSYIVTESFSIQVFGLKPYFPSGKILSESEFQALSDKYSGRYDKYFKLVR